MIRPLPVLLLVAFAVGIYFLAFPFGDDTGGVPQVPVGPGTEGPALAVQEHKPEDLQQPSDNSGLAEVPTAADTQRVESPHAILANSVSGRVVANGEGLEGVEVTLTKFGYEASLFGPPSGDQRLGDRTEMTQADGSFVFRNVETYTDLSLIAKHPKYGRKEEGNIQISEGEARDNLLITLGEGVRLHGRVSDSSNNPVAGAKLLLGMASLGAIADDNGPNTLSAVSSADGSYEFLSVDSGNYSMTVKADGYGRMTIQQMNVTGQAGVLRDVTLSVAYMIGGTVTSQDGVPLVEATVQAFSHPNSRAETTRSSVETNDAGEFLFDDIGAGAYTLMFSAKGYQTDREPRIETGEMSLTVALTPLPLVRGRVVDSLGEPVRDFTVLLRNPVQNTDTTMAIPSTTQKVVDSLDGSFALSCPKRGAFVVEARDENHAPSFSEPFEIVYGQELSGIVVQLTLGGTLRGRVVDAQGKGVAGARVKTQDTQYADDAFFRSLDAFPSEATVKEVRTNASGDFEISGLSAATYQVDVRHARYSQTIKTGIVVTGDNMLELPEIQLAEGATIQGTVHGPSGKGLAGAVVQLQMDGSSGDVRFNLSVSTDPQGKYTFRHVPAGSYNIHAKRRNDSNPFQGSLDLQKTRVRISVSEGESYVQEFNITN